MSNPGRILAQVAILGSQILGKAFVQAWRQAARNAQGSGRVAGPGGAAQGTARGADRVHGMTIDEAAQILNVRKQGLVEKDPSELQQMLKNFDHLFATNAPLKDGKPHSSHYLQSKIVRAKERIEADVMGGPKPAGEAAAPPPPPPPSA